MSCEDLGRPDNDWLCFLAKVCRWCRSHLGDADGRRARKTINGVATQFLYDGLNPVQEIQNGAPSANLLTGLGTDEYLQRTDSAGARDYLTDILSSTLALTDATGLIQTQYSYDPFGNIGAIGQTSSNSYQFTGRENDNTALYYNRNRYYSPSLGRFTSQDPIEFAGGTNLYAYTFDDPTNLIDASGLDAYICDRPVFPSPIELPWGGYHQYDCVIEGKFVICFGLGPASLSDSLGGPGKLEPDQPNKSCQKKSNKPCVDTCLLGFLLDPPPDYDPDNLGGGINCHKFARDAITYCEAVCAAE